MISRFYCGEIDQKLSVLDYDGSRTSGRWRAVVNDDQVTVLHLQSVAVRDTPVSHLSLCPGVRETDVLRLLSQSPATSLACTTFLIEKVSEEIVYRSRHCQLLCRTEEPVDFCSDCHELLDSLKVQVDEEESPHSPNLDMKGNFGKDEDDNDNDGKETMADYCDTVIKILKDEPLDDYPQSDHFETENSFPLLSTNPPSAGGQKKKKRVRKVKSSSGDEQLTDPSEKVQKKKKTKKNFFCPQCPESFFYQLNIVKHASKQHGLFLPVPLKPGMTRCPFCAEIYNEDSPFFLAHLKYSHPHQRENTVYKEIVDRISVAKYICSTCGKDFLSNRSLEDHMVEVHSTHINALPCDVCGKCFKSRGTLENHRKKVHENSHEEHLCVECGKIFNSKRNLVLHFERHHSNKEFVCHDCEAIFRSRKDLREHIKRRHTVREKTEKCTRCDKDFYSTVALKKHISNVHEKVKPFYCEVCVFRCSRLSNLNVHRKTHNKDRISKAMLISMVENEEHPFYSKDDLPMLRNSVAD